MTANPFTFTYRADGQRVTQGDPSGATTTFGYDRLGRLTDKDVADSNRTSGTCATLDWTYNRAGNRLTEHQDTMGTPGTDGTSTLTYDKAGRITGCDSPLGGTSTDQAYGWQKVADSPAIRRTRRTLFSKESEHRTVGEAESQPQASGWLCGLDGSSDHRRW